MLDSKCGGLRDSDRSAGHAPRRRLSMLRGSGLDGGGGGGGGPEPAGVGGLGGGGGRRGGLLIGERWAKRDRNRLYIEQVRVREKERERETREGEERD